MTYFDLEIQLIQYFQSIKFLEPIMWVFTILGKADFYPIILAALMLLVNYRFSVKAGIYLSTILGFENALKLILHQPRPFWVTQKIKALNTSGGFGAPSGHAIASIFWIYIANYMKKTWFWILAIFIVFLIGLSRVYLGAHFAYQVILGWIIALSIMLLMPRIENIVYESTKKYSFKKKALISFLGSLVFVIIGILITIVFNGWQMNPDYANNILAVENQKFLDNIQINFDGLMKYGGMFFGILFGSLLILRKGEVVLKGSLKIKTMRLIAGFLIIYFVMQMSRILKLIPDFNLFTIGIVEYLMGFVVMFLSFYLTPLILSKFKLIGLEK